MKTILLIFALLFAHQSIAVAPYGFKGQDQTATQYSNVLKFKNRSVVKTGGINSLVEDQDNLLYNGGFEATPDLDGWTCVGAGSSFTIESKPVSASVVISGDRTLAIGCATVGGCTCTQDFPVNLQQAGRSVLLSGIVRTSSDVQGLKLTYRENGADTSITTENVLNGIPATEAVIGSSATTIGIKLTVPYSATPTIVRVDEIKMAYGTAVTNQPPIGPEFSWTPVTQGLGTISPSTNACSGNQSGPNLILTCRFTTGTIPVGVEVRIGLPSNLTVSSSVSGTRKLGDVFRGVATGTTIKRFTAISTSGLNYLNVGVDDYTNASSPLVAGVSNALFASGEPVVIQAIIPIAQYASSIPTYTGRCNDPRACETVFSAKVSATGVVTDENLDWINGNCSLTSTSQFDCPLNGGIYNLIPNCSATIATPSFSGVTINYDYANSTVSNLRFRTMNSSNGTVNAQPFSITCQRQGQDYINAKVNQIVGSFKDYVRTPNTSTGKVGFCSAKISATGVISDQLGGCFASCTNATTPVCTFTSNYWKSGSVPNCWAQGSSTDGVTIVPYQDSSFISSTSYGAPFVGLVSGTVASGNRKYFCHGEIQ